MPGDDGGQVLRGAIGIDSGAVNLLSSAFGDGGAAGVTPMETSVTDVTFRVVDPDRVPEAAVMVVDPTATAVAIPLLPATLPIDATSQRSNST